jgi:RimJ/RimL family protein N-acetyltransferase
MALPAADSARYPRELERHVTLRDGSRVQLRPIRPDDQAHLIEFYDRLSRHTAYQRFFTVMRRLPPDWARLLATVDYRRRLALIAEHAGPGGLELVGVGRYEPTDREDTAEVAFVVQDGWQNRGLGTVLFQDILAAAVARGMRRFVAYVLADNLRMLDLISRFTEVEQRKTDHGIVEIAFRPRPAQAGGRTPSRTE